jgi:hypothetical protein
VGFKRKWKYGNEELAKLLKLSVPNLRKLELNGEIDKGDLESICKVYLKLVLLPSIEQYCVMRKESWD